MNSTSEQPPVLWAPSPERIKATEIDRFRRDVRPQASNYDELWEWSTTEPGPFWRSVWDWCEVVGDPGDRLVEPGENFWETRFCPDATLNVAENVLAHRAGAAEHAIIALREDGSERLITWDELRSEVAAMAAFFRTVGVRRGDVVGAWMPHVAETVVAFLAASSIGAVFTSTSADFGVNGVVDRFGQTEPVLLVGADGYSYGGKDFDCLARLGEIASQLPSVKTVIVAPVLTSQPDLAALGLDQSTATVIGWHDALAAPSTTSADLTFEQLPTDHPLYVLYSSGTTGKPKCIVHRSGGVLLKHLTEQRLHSDIAPGDTVFYFTTCGWMMWNWLVSCLASGATIVLFDGSPVHPTRGTVFDLADRYGVTFLGVSAKFIDSTMKAGLVPRESHELDTVKSICSTGSPLSPEGFSWVYDSVKSDVHLVSMSGGTDLCGCLVAGDPTRAVVPGEIQVPTLGLGTTVFGDGGEHLTDGSQGELVCTTPFPSMPLGFGGDPDGGRYRAAYFERFDGVWAHGDYASMTERGGMVIHGRSDATLNASGIRIGTAEIYGVVEQIDAITEAIAIGQEWDDDTRIVLFVTLAEGAELDEELVAQIKRDLRTKCSPRHVPAVVKAVADIPRTRSGKIVELAVTEVVHGRPVKNLEALANPEALDLFAL